MRISRSAALKTSPSLEQEAQIFIPLASLSTCAVVILFFRARTASMHFSRSVSGRAGGLNAAATPECAAGIPAQAPCRKQRSFAGQGRERREADK